MKKLNRQAGISLMSFIMWLIIVGVILGYGSQVGLVYLKKRTMSQNIQQVLKEAQTRDLAPSTREIQTSIVKRFDVNDMNIKAEDIIVKKEGNSFRVTVAATKEIKINSSMTLVVDYGIEETSASSK